MNNELEELKHSINLYDYVTRNYLESHIVLKTDKFVRLNPCPICGKEDHFDIYTNTNSFTSRSGCSNGGSIIDFLMAAENLSKGDAIKKLKELNGKYESFKPKEIVLEDKKVIDFSILIDAATKNVYATKYYLERGFSEEVIKKHNLGYFSTGLNYAIAKFPKLFPEGKKTNDWFKNYKYFIPCYNQSGKPVFFINRYDDNEAVPEWVTKHFKVMNPKGSSPIPLNLKYLYEELFKKEYIFICEGWADALSFETMGYKAISLNSTDNYKILTNYIDSLDDILLKNKIFIICGDHDGAGSKMNINLKNYFNNKKIEFNIFLLPEDDEIKDINDLLRKDKKQFEVIINDFLESINNYEYKFDDYEEFNDPEIPIFEENNCYWKRLKDDGKQSLSNFIIQPITIVDNAEFTEIRTLIISNRGFKVERTFTLDNFLSVQKFKGALNHFALSFIGRDTDLEHIKNIISYKKCDIKQGVDRTGFHKVNKKWCFVSGTKAANENGEIIDNIVMSKHLKEIDTDILDIEPITKIELLELAPNLFKFNSLRKVSIVLGYCAAVWCKEILWVNDNNVRFPHLLLIGEAGSGKSGTFDNVISTILNILSKPIGASSTTKFSLDRLVSSSNTVPCIIEEYKPAFIGINKVNMISGLVRESYGHETTIRGNKDRTVEKLTYSAPLIIIGESDTDETAFKERSLFVLFSKKDLDIDDHRSRFKYIMRNSELLNKFGRSLFDVVLKSDKNKLNTRIEELEKYISDQITADRVKTSLSILFLGISIIEEVFSNLGLDMENVIGVTKNEMYSAINEATFEDLMDSSTSSKSVIDITLESFNTLVNMGKLIKDFNYTVINRGAELAIHMATTYPIFNENKINLQTECITSVNQFNKQLRGMPYYVDAKAVKLNKESYSQNIQKVNKKCVVLDIALLKARGLDVSELIGEEYVDTDLVKILNEKINIGKQLSIPDDDYELPF